MTAIAVLTGVAVIAGAAYYLRLHLEWRREVRRRRADRERERKFLRRVELDLPGRIDVIER